jgi:hypothetical protein
MSNYLISTVEQWNVPTVEAALELQKEFEEDSSYELSSFTYTHKEIKSKGEVESTFELVKATKKFNDSKYPDTVISVGYKEI